MTILAHPLHPSPSIIRDTQLSRCVYLIIHAAMADLFAYMQAVLLPIGRQIAYLWNVAIHSGFPLIFWVQPRWSVDEMTDQSGKVPCDSSRAYTRSSSSPVQIAGLASPLPGHSMRLGPKYTWPAEAKTRLGKLSNSYSRTGGRVKRVPAKES
jgi:hypothetical protein